MHETALQRFWKRSYLDFVVEFSWTKGTVIVFQIEIGIISPPNMFCSVVCSGLIMWLRLTVPGYGPGISYFIYLTWSKVA